jgi:hypothetical protein
VADEEAAGPGLTEAVQDLLVLVDGGDVPALGVQVLCDL